MRTRIKSPKTNRMIYVGGDTYHQLLKDYDEDYLLSFTNQPDFVLTGVNDTDILILQQLNDEDLLNACQTNKRINKLCNDNRILDNRIQNYIKLNQKLFNSMTYKIAKAIDAGRDKKGLSRQFIKKFLESNYKIEPTDPWINFTLYILSNRKEGERLIVNPHHTGHYKLSPALKKLIKD